MLRIHIPSITPQGLDIEEVVDAFELPMLKSVARKASVDFTGPVHTRLHASQNGELVQIIGSVATGADVPCSRCLEPFQLKIESDFSVTAAPESASEDNHSAGSDIELIAEEMDVIAYRGDDIDLGDEIAQQVIMAIPFNPLCRETCRGLCSRCGTNLNETSCRCSSQDKKNPFSVLKTLSFPKQPE